MSSTRVRLNITDRIEQGPCPPMRTDGRLQMWMPDNPRHEDEQGKQQPDHEEHDFERPIPSKSDPPDASSGSSVHAAGPRPVVPSLFGCAHGPVRKHHRGRATELFSIRCRQMRVTGRNSEMTGGGRCAIAAGAAHAGCGTADGSLAV